MDIAEREVTDCGPSGCSKSTLLRCINRMNDLIESARIIVEKLKLMSRYLRRTGGCDRVEKRLHGFPKIESVSQSIYENVIYGLRIQGINRKSELDEAVERASRDRFGKRLRTDWIRVG